LRGSIPLGFGNAAINLGISGGFIIPWGKGFSKKTTPISDRFFIGGNASLACDINGPVKMPGFHCRGVGPMDVRKAINSISPEGTEEKLRDALGGDISVTGFADLSFDLPWKYLRERNVHGHCFICGGNLIGLPDIDQFMSVKRFWSSTRVSAGAGLVIPTRLFRLEVGSALHYT
jgi:outer membrane protein insertion porin family